MSAVMELIRDQFADKLVEDDREPIHEFGIKGLEGTYALYPPRLEIWKQLFVVSIIQHCWTHCFGFNFCAANPLILASTASDAMPGCPAILFHCGLQIHPSQPRIHGSLSARMGRTHTTFSLDSSLSLSLLFFFLCFLGDGF